jgi:hypothetical protein
MVIHFIGPSRESAALYHNNPFDSSNLSHEFLFARFAWAIIKRAHTAFMFHSAGGQKAFGLQTVNAAPLNEKEEAMGEMGTNRLTRNELVLPGDKRAKARRGKKVSWRRI